MIHLVLNSGIESVQDLFISSNLLKTVCTESAECNG